VVLLLVSYRLCRLSTLPLCLSNDLEESDWHETPRRRDGGVAGFVPVRVVLSTEYVEKIAFIEGKLVRMIRLWLVVVQRLDDLDGVWLAGGTLQPDGAYDPPSSEV
jgi:hypothetical protein